ncbi:GNAT family N-acetyltransferase [Phenylobacterium sp.]|uniref:GNAT family N-acetyltransferase n=1 Tax=Phenylobacterium sp. TaxID=1871053 RepID=UPI0035ADA701
MGFRVRLAYPDEVDQLPPVERSAAELFRGSAQDHVADGEVSPAPFYRPLAEAGLVWVAEAGDGIAGFAACEAFDDALHIWELAVARPYQARGIGRALVEDAVRAARTMGLPAVTLTTFADIAWNAPLYRKLGFRALDGAERPQRLRDVLAREAARGLTGRCAMRRDLA